MSKMVFRFSIVVFMLNLVFFMSGCNNEDEVAPVFSNVPEDQIVEHGESLYLLSLGITASDDVDGDITNNITVNMSNPKYTIPGVYDVVYTVSDLAGNVNSVTISVTIYTNAESFLYELINDDTEIRITDYLDEITKSVVIPQFINGLPVTEIGYQAFKSAELTTVTLLEGLKVIDKGAFLFNDITHIYIPSTVISIGEEAFRGNLINEYDVSEENTFYKDLDNALYTKDGKSIIDFPNENNPTTYSIPEGVEVICESAFSGAQMISVTFPESLITIERGAFSFNSLTSVVLGDNVTSIGDSAFFFNNIETLELSNSLTYIGDSAFIRNQLRTLTIPSSVEVIEESAFSDNKLTELILSDGILYIKKAAFHNNYLVDIVIPASLTEIGIVAFLENDTIESFVVDEDNETFKSIDGVLFSKDGTVLLDFPVNSSLTSYTIPKGVLEIGNDAFKKSSLTEIIFNEELNIIGKYAFSSNNLTEIEIPDSVTLIDWNAFANNELTILVIPEGVETIAFGAFEGNLLTDVTISSTVTYIGQISFRYNPITSIIILGDPLRFNDSWEYIHFPLELLDD